MIKTNLLIALCFLFTNIHLIGQTQIQLVRGTVIDEDTRQALIGATVSILNSEI
ncbi:MAG: hypothetical protein ACI9P5_003855 [Saprospiraceae bacterium]|jgi:hypothetical protein